MVANEEGLDEGREEPDTVNIMLAEREQTARLSRHAGCSFGSLVE